MGYFVHVPKTAGGSVRYFSRELGFEIVGHNLRDPNYLPFGMYSDRLHYFSFAFVRHPIDRALSAFHFLNEGGINDLDKADAEKFVTPYAGDFDSFVKTEVARGEVLKQLHFVPQTFWICNARQEICVDYVARFERLSDEIGKLSRLARRQGFQLPKRNTSTRPKTPISDEGIELLREAYKMDYALLNYD